VAVSTKVRGKNLRTVSPDTRHLAINSGISNDEGMGTHESVTDDEVVICTEIAPSVRGCRRACVDNTKISQKSAL